ncbi:5-formyltetrahydrofolate cyclo-ligase [Spartinivicinus ruber]|uniref:5-formyltetrahydrofolate cyclo-ligase n=1 Tax=Spartinivicinus ruber TaxID=2683272 RepID=UPI0013D7776C|nr:5-formyltetrahydrofolate cyclo-ligase [Spartinivicinus ruber]
MPESNNNSFVTSHHSDLNCLSAKQYQPAINSHQLVVSDSAPANPQQRKALRNQLRRARRALTYQQQRLAGQRLLKILLRRQEFLKAKHIAVYLANDGEINPRQIIEAAWSMGKTCYLPVLHPIYHNRLWFLRYQPTTKLAPNRFNILEPTVSNGQVKSAWAMDLVLLPLVGFDQQGGRLGMGGGFYDRTFEFILKSPRKPRPKLVGLAHECQRVNKLPIASWDIPLAGIASDAKYYDVI